MCPKRATLACNYPMMNSKDGDKPKWQTSNRAMTRTKGDNEQQQK